MNIPNPSRTQTNGLRTFAIVIGAVLIAAASIYYFNSRHYESTDDANIESHVTAVSPNISGTVSKVLVTDNQEVKEGDLLVLIDARPFETKLGHARADEQSAAADAARAKTDLERAQTLFAQDAISRQTLDHTVASAQSAQAKLDGARKSVASDELDVSYTKITAPVAGRITRKSVEEGSYVQTGQELLAVVPHQVWVVANFKETQLTYMRPGQEVDIRVDAYPGVPFTGRIESVQHGTGSRFSLMPAENATGNFVKVVQRVPVKVVFDPTPDPKYLLAPGMSVEPTVKVR